MTHQSTKGCGRFQREGNQGPLERRKRGRNNKNRNKRNECGSFPLALLCSLSTFCLRSDEQKSSTESDNLPSVQEEKKEKRSEVGGADFK
jgi:hypothetical protein